jgi:hypothetical protein
MRIRTANNILFGSIVAMIGIANEFSITKSNTNHGVVGFVGVQTRCSARITTTMAARLSITRTSTGREGEKNKYCSLRTTNLLCNLYRIFSSSSIRRGSTISSNLVSSHKCEYNYDNKNSPSTYDDDEEVQALGDERELFEVIQNDDKNSNRIHDTYTNTDTHTTPIAAINTKMNMKTPTKENNNGEYSLFWFVMGILFVLGGKFLSSKLSSASAFATTTNNIITSSIIDDPTISSLISLHNEQQKKKYTSVTSLFMSIILLLQQRGLRLSSPSRSTTSSTRPAEVISTTTRSVSSNTTMNTLQKASSPSLLLFISGVGTTHYFSTFRLLFSFYGSSIANWYMNALTSSPLITKTITTSFIGVLGDTLAQYIELRVQTKKDDITTKSTTCINTTTISNNKNIPKYRLLSWLQKYDRRRGFSVLGENLLISGPLMHFAYNYMEEIIPIATEVAVVGMSAHIAALTHVLLDNFVLDTFFVFIMFVTTGIAEGYMHQIIPQLRRDFIPTVKTAWISGLLMMPLQFLLFRFLPLSLRVLGVNIIDIFWEAYISYMVHRRRTKNKEQQQ